MEAFGGPAFGGNGRQPSGQLGTAGEWFHTQHERQMSGAGLRRRRRLVHR